MSVDIENLKKAIEDNRVLYEAKLKHQLKRFKWFDKWIRVNDFDTLIYKVILKHDEEYCEKCYHNGCEPYPNNVLEFIFEYVMFKNNVVKVKELETNFPNTVWKIQNYYFQIIQGQGAVLRIYNKEDKRLLLQF